MELDHRSLSWLEDSELLHLGDQCRPLKPQPGGGALASPDQSSGGAHRLQNQGRFPIPQCVPREAIGGILFPCGVGRGFGSTQLSDRRLAQSDFGVPVHYRANGMRGMHSSLSPVGFTQKGLHSFGPGDFALIFRKRIRSISCKRLYGFGIIDHRGSCVENRTLKRRLSCEFHV